MKRFFLCIICCLFFLSACTPQAVLIGRQTPQFTSPPTVENFTAAYAQTATKPVSRYLFDVRMGETSLKLGDILEYHGKALNFTLEISVSESEEFVGFVLCDGVPCPLDNGTLQYHVSLSANETKTVSLSLIPPVAKHGLQKLSFVWLTDAEQQFAYVFDVLLDVQNDCKLTAVDICSTYETLPLSEEFPEFTEFMWENVSNTVASVVYRDDPYNNSATYNGWTQSSVINHNLNPPVDKSMCYYRYDATAPKGEYASIFLIDDRIYSIWDGRVALRWRIEDGEMIRVEPLALPYDPDLEKATFYTFRSVSIPLDSQILGQIDGMGPVYFSATASGQYGGDTTLKSIKSALQVVRKASDNQTVTEEGVTVYHGGELHFQVRDETRLRFDSLQQKTFTNGYVVCVNGIPVPFSVNGSSEKQHFYTVELKTLSSAEFDISFLPPLHDTESVFCVQVFRIRELNQAINSLALSSYKFWYLPQGDMTENRAAYDASFDSLVSIGSDDLHEASETPSTAFDLYSETSEYTKNSEGILRYLLTEEDPAFQIQGVPQVFGKERNVLCVFLDGKFLSLFDGKPFLLVDWSQHPNGLSIDFDFDWESLPSGKHIVDIVLLPSLVYEIGETNRPVNYMMHYASCILMKPVAEESKSIAQLQYYRDENDSGAVSIGFQQDRICNVSVYSSRHYTDGENSKLYRDVTGIRWFSGTLQYVLANDTFVPFGEMAGSDQILSVSVGDYGTENSLCVEHFALARENLKKSAN